jgi:hypothetical protein
MAPFGFAAQEPRSFHKAVTFPNQQRCDATLSHRIDKNTDSELYHFVLVEPLLYSSLD